MKFWINNILVTIGIVLFYLIASYFFTGTIVGLICVTLAWIGSFSQLCFSGIYAIRGFKLFPLNMKILAIASTLFTLIVTLFIFSASFWDTNAGWWKTM